MCETDLRDPTETLHLRRSTRRRATGLLLALAAGFLTIPCLGQLPSGPPPDSEVLETALEYFGHYQDIDVESFDLEILRSFYNQDSVLKDPALHRQIDKRGGDDIIQHFERLRSLVQKFRLKPEEYYQNQEFVVIQGAYELGYRPGHRGGELFSGHFAILLKLERSSDGGYLVAEHQEFLEYKPGKKFSPLRNAIVGLSYFLWTLALGLIIYRGFKYQTWGMPMIGSASMLALVFLTGFVGPWREPELFFPKENLTLVWVWRTWFVIVAVIFLQYLLYNRSKGARAVALLTLGGSVITTWTFITFYQDYYVNEANAIVLLIMTLAYLWELGVGRDLTGMSPTIAWCLALGTAALYVPTLAGDMIDAFPFAYHGHAFIYWVFGITIVLLVIYAVLVTLGPKPEKRSTSTP